MMSATSQAVSRHLRARDYRPGTGAFTTKDLVPGIPGTATVANADAYASNDPLDLVDPLGLSPVVDGDMGGYRSDWVIQENHGQVPEDSIADAAEYFIIKAGDHRGFLAAAAAWGIGRVLGWVDQTRAAETSRRSRLVSRNFKNQAV